MPATMNTSNVDEKGREMVRCEACFSEGGKLAHFHVLGAHLKSNHGISTKQYSEMFPAAPLLSAHAQATLLEARKAKEAKPALTVVKEEPKPEPLNFGVATLYIRTGLDADAQSMVPEHDDKFELDELKLEAFALAMEKGENVLMVGPTGAGKTSFAEEVAAIINQPVASMGMNGDTRAADFVGERVIEVDPESGQAVVMWRDGILPTAMRRGYWLVLDELDAAPPQILFTLQGVLDHRRTLVLPGNHGEVVKAHPHFRVVATANTLGKGDDSGLYAGTRILNEAFLDRFGTVLQWDYLPGAKEAEVVASKSGLDKAVAIKMVECASLVRKGFIDEDCFTTFSTRRLIAWAVKTVALGSGGHKAGDKPHWRAAQLTVFNKLTGDDLNFVMDIVKKVMGK